MAPHWLPKEELAEDFQSYVHLVDPEGNVVSQSDQRPGGDHYSGTLWTIPQFRSSIFQPSCALLVPSLDLAVWGSVLLLSGYLHAQGCRVGIR